MRRTGTVVVSTVVRVPPAQFKDQAPYAMAIVRMDDGPSITTQIVDWQEAQLKTGAKVKLEFRRISDDGEAGTINYGYKAVPV